MGLKLGSTLAVLALALFIYRAWDRTRVPHNVADEDIWKVKTIEFVCFMLNKVVSTVKYCQTCHNIVT